MILVPVHTNTVCSRVFSHAQILAEHLKHVGYIPAVDPIAVHAQRLNQVLDLMVPTCSKRIVQQAYGAIRMMCKQSMVQLENTTVTTLQQKCVEQQGMVQQMRYDLDGVVRVEHGAVKKNCSSQIMVQLLVKQCSAIRVEYQPAGTKTVCPASCTKSIRMTVANPGNS